MPSAVLDLASVLALVVMLVVAFVHPKGWVETLFGLGAAGLVGALGAVTYAEASAEVRQLFPVVAFLAAILVVAEICSAEGVFSAVGSIVAHASRHRPQRMLALTFLAAAVTTAVLSLDATVVLLTPVVAAAATSTLVSPRPVVYACVRLANSASLLLPVSNLTNLLALPSLHLSFVQFALVMAPVWLVTIGVEYVGQRLFFAGDLGSRPGDGTSRREERLPVVPLVVVGLMLVGFAVASPLGVAPAWVAAAAAVVLAAYSLGRGQVTPRVVLRATHVSFSVFVLCLGVVVASLSDTFLGAAVSALVPGSDGLAQLLVLALLATALANLVNNLPATLLLVPLVAPLGVPALLATLVGLNVGSSLTYTGSLANLLWRRSLIRHGAHPSARTFHLLSAAVTLPAVAVATVTLWASAAICGHLGWL
ncbi:MAG: SLC13 family permease [Nocardioidaceae bacterium]